MVESHLNLGLFSGGWVTCFDRKFIFLSLSPSFRLFLISGRLFVLGNFRIRVERIRYYIRGWESIILRKIGEFFKSTDFALKDDFGDFVEYENARQNFRSKSNR